MVLPVLGETSSSFAFKDPLRIIAGNDVEKQENSMSSSHPKIEEISSGTDSGPVSSRGTLMATSLLGGDSFRSNLIMTRRDTSFSPSVANRSAQNVRRGTHSCGYCYSRCGRLFVRLPNLRAHSRRYSGEEPYICLACHTTFRWYSGFVSHNEICPRRMQTSDSQDGKPGYLLRRGDA